MVVIILGLDPVDIGTDVEVGHAQEYVIRVVNRLRIAGSVEVPSLSEKAIKRWRCAITV